MRLRKQLFLLSLVSLALPWVGCQAIREMDQSLRTAQLNTLNATASAVAARFASDPLLSAKISAHNRGNTEKAVNSASSIYAHALVEPIYLDGYGEDDWLGQGIALMPLAIKAQAPATQVRFATGVRGDILYGFIKIKTPHIHYFRPSDLNLSKSDYLQINTQNAAFALFASAPGRIRALRLSEESNVSNKATAHQIQGFWLESKDGFQLEFSMPIALAARGLGLRFIDASNPPSKENEIDPGIRPLISPSETLSKELGVFAKFDTRLHIVNPQQYRLASAGQVQSTPQGQQTHGFLAWLYALALGKPRFSDFGDHSSQGKIASETIQRALKGENAQSWYRHEGMNLAQASVAIIRDNRILGAVIAEQSENSLRSLTDNAFGRLLSYSFLASILAALSLVSFATILSLRIRRLNEAALNAISDGGKIAEHFPVSRSGDEIGELSRSYNQLLERLREYTQYLRSLSSKLSHELRTPLAIVRTSLDNLEHEQIDGKAAEYSARAREGANRLSHIISAMSAASRVEQAIEQAEIELIECYRLLSDLTEAYGSVYLKVKFSLSASPEIENLRIKGSPELLVQALDKLVDNAVDFSPVGERIKIEACADKNWLLIRVHNRGPLLPNSMQGQLFDSMVSVRSSAKAHSDSSVEPPAAPSANNNSSHHLGLGLYIVRLICDFHAGEARAFNAEDLAGVVFELRLPLHKDEGDIKKERD